MLRILVDAHANPHAVTARGANVLLQVLSKQQSDPDSVRLSLDLRADVNHQMLPTTLEARMINRVCATIVWCRQHVCSLTTGGLVQRVASREGATALHSAAEKADVPVVRILLEATADPTLRTAQGRSVLDFTEAGLGEVPPVVAALFE